MLVVKQAIVSLCQFYDGKIYGCKKVDYGAIYNKVKDMQKRLFKQQTILTGYLTIEDM